MCLVRSFQVIALLYRETHPLASEMFIKTHKEKKKNNVEEQKKNNAEEEKKNNAEEEKKNNAEEEKKIKK